MKNKEKYFDEILETFSKPSHTESVCKFKCAKILKANNCEGISCIKCTERFKQWLEEEYIETIDLTDDEITILKNIPDGYQWIVRFEKGGLVVSEFKPQRINRTWRIAPSMDLYLFNHLFQFITPEDEEPYNIDELLKPYGVTR